MAYSLFHGGNCVYVSISFCNGTVFSLTYCLQSAISLSWTLYLLTKAAFCTISSQPLMIPRHRMPAPPHLICKSLCGFMFVCVRHPHPSARRVQVSKANARDELETFSIFPCSLFIGCRLILCQKRYNRLTSIMCFCHVSLIDESPATESIWLQHERISPHNFLLRDEPDAVPQIIFPSAKQSACVSGSSGPFVSFNNW